MNVQKQSSHSNNFGIKHTSESVTSLSQHTTMSSNSNSPSLGIVGLPVSYVSFQWMIEFTIRYDSRVEREQAFYFIFTELEFVVVGHSFILGNDVTLQSHKNMTQWGLRD